jgi:hypothetical protein
MGTMIAERGRNKYLLSPYVRFAVIISLFSFLMVPKVKNNRKMVMNPLPSFIEARDSDSKDPKNNAAQSTDSRGAIDTCESLMHRNSSTAAVSLLRPGISSSRSHNALLPPQRPEEQEEPEDSSSFAHRSSPASSEDQNSCSSTFPRMLLKMLEDAESKDFENIVSWVPGQKNLFRVYNIERFTREIAPLYFKCTQYTSFQRQLNLYGFSRIKAGPYKGGYTHELLVRDSPELCDYIIRAKKKVKEGKSYLGSSVLSMLSSSAGTTARPLVSQEKREDRSQLSTRLEYMYQFVGQELNNKKQLTPIKDKLLESCSNDTNQEVKDPSAVFGHNDSHPRELQPGSLSPHSVNHSDGFVANPRTTSSIVRHPPIFHSPLQSSGRAFDSSTHFGAFSFEEIMDEIIQTFSSTRDEIMDKIFETF